MIPRPLRYRPPVAAVGGRLLIAGGTSGPKRPQRAILAFDPANPRGAPGSASFLLAR